MRTSPELKNLTEEQLKSLVEEAQHRIDEQTAGRLYPLYQEYVAMLERIQRALEPHDLTVAEFRAGASKGKDYLATLVRERRIGKESRSAAPAHAKYHHPNDPSKTWTGRGKRPTWVKEFLASGGVLPGLAPVKPRRKRDAKAAKKVVAKKAPAKKAVKRPAKKSAKRS